MSAVLRDILVAVTPTIRENGYKGTGQNYRRATDSAVSTVNFQKSSGGERFYVNVGVQPLFVPTEGGSTPDAKKIKAYECIFRTRLNPPDTELFGWPYSTDVSADLIQGFDELFQKFVTPLMTIPGPITEAGVFDVPADSLHPLFGAWNARTFLHFARISLAMGNCERAVGFANAAIERCNPNAKSLLHHLEQILVNASE